MMFSPSACGLYSDIPFIVNIRFLAETVDSRYPSYRSNPGESPGKAGGLPQELCEVIQEETND